MLKAQWVVTAEVIPGQEVESLTKAWYYTSQDAHEDAKIQKGQPTIFTRCIREAGEYAMSLQDPFQVNIINLKFMWM